MRALREAKYAAAAKANPRPPASTPAARQAPAGRPSPAAGKARAATTTGPASPIMPEAGRCGHRNMGGKSCTRDAGHSEKNHRYS